MLLRACATIIPIDPRRRIEAGPFKNGLMIRRSSSDDVPLVPEALYLTSKLAPHFVTFETPSEFSLNGRVRAHVRLIETCVRRLSTACG